ncbi:hypothetical protein MYSTI_02404 [Myxococcus stipitatus DSM 14675]|uniref:ActD-like protein n=1 Tax=Myxococcus stipitatus (strain DSM 14675 / JCM 12634 / Mx s8) TaxID=1278073 RepID=L7U794_MYXSD|nr:hypothetical protein [Myxococcus stipitatus]AGC43720.1 hypothetical protein MYSTI_02404 [Myxococcus stipitatus DSM 14675]
MNPTSIPRFPGVPDLLLERYLCDELSAEEALRVEEAARVSPELSAHLRERRAEKAAFALVRPFGPVRERLAPPRQSRWRGLWRWSLPVLVLGVGLTAVVPRLIALEEVERVRVRGGLTARVLVKRGDVVFEQGPGVVLRPGDRVRVEVEDVAGGALYVLALSERGRVTPLQGFEITGGALSMAPGRWVLPGSLELDAAPEQEALVVVLASDSQDAPSPEVVQRWLEHAAREPDFPPSPMPLPGTRHAVRVLPKELP